MSTIDLDDVAVWRGNDRRALVPVARDDTIQTILNFGDQLIKILRDMHCINNCMIRMSAGYAAAISETIPTKVIVFQYI
jgi:hypothetical protein